MTVRSHAAIRQAWIERLERFSQSQQSVAQFCADEGVSTASLYQWRRKLQTDPVESPAVARFVPVTLPTDQLPTPATVMSVELPGGIRVRFEITGCGAEPT
jgi:transposase-like protein